MIHAETVRFAGEHEESIRMIRGTVFSDEQNVSPAIDFDGQDEAALHVLVSIGQKPCGTGRMLEDGHIGRIAVLREMRGQGLGRRVVEALIGEARARSYARVYLGSQTHAIGFYEKLGFTPFGEEYTEADMQHISMEKRLAPATKDSPRRE